MVSKFEVDLIGIASMMNDDSLTDTSVIQNLSVHQDTT